jgi:hypothetical protein
VFTYLTVLYQLQILVNKLSIYDDKFGGLFEEAVVKCRTENKQLAILD